MKIGIRVTTLLFLLVAAFPAAYSQDNETVVRPLQLSVFGTGGATYTGIEGGRNISITAGGDAMFGLLTYHGFLPGIEIRCTSPAISKGEIDSQQNFLGGLKAERHYGKLHPYFDVLFGRGEIDYSKAGLLNPQKTILYEKSNSNVIAAGVGFDYDVFSSLALKVDVQFQDYSTVPVTTSGSATATSFTIGATYRFGFRDSRPY